MARKRHEQFIKEVYDLVGDNYTIISEYQGAMAKIKIKHVECDYTYLVTPNNFLKGRRCPKCSGLIKKTHEKFVKEVFELVGNEYRILGKYKNNHSKIEIKHSFCGHEYKIKPFSFLLGIRCPHCKSSKGEIAISKWLDDNNIIYIPQYKFEDCKHINLLKFDFAIFDKQNNLMFLLEYDGEGHFKPFTFSKNEELNIKNFKDGQQRDQIKNEYCNKNSIPLLRIPYWEKNNIDDILNKFFKNSIQNN